MSPLNRITRGEAWIAAGTHRWREKSASNRGQACGAFGRDLALASEWFTPADSVCMRLAKVLAESHGRTTAAALARLFGHVVLATIAQAEGDRSKDAAIGFIDFIREKDGRRSYMACGVREPVESVDGFISERITAVNLSFVIRSVRAAATRERLPGFDAPMMPPTGSMEYAVIMAPYAEAALSDLVAEADMRKAEAVAPVRACWRGRLRWARRSRSGRASRTRRRKTARRARTQKTMLKKARRGTAAKPG